MKVALAFWGLTRSLQYTMPSIQARILDVLKKHGIDYTIFLHTYYVNTIYTNTRAREYGIQLNNEEYKLLGANYVQRESQDELKNTLNLTAYRTYPDPWETQYQMVDNFILAMYSKKQLGLMVEAAVKGGEAFDYVLFLRPDCEYVTDFDVRWFSRANDTTICVPDFHCFHFKFNDRFALAKPSVALRYSKIFDIMLDYSRKMPLHSESTNYYYAAEVLKLKIEYIPFHFNRVRANGVFRKDIY